MPGLLKSPPMILAAEGPSKVAPPNESTVQSPSDSGGLLLKDSTAPTRRRSRSSRRRSSPSICWRRRPRRRRRADRPGRRRPTVTVGARSARLRRAAPTGSCRSGARLADRPTSETPVLARRASAPRSRPRFPSAKAGEDGLGASGRDIDLDRNGRLMPRSLEVPRRSEPGADAPARKPEKPARCSSRRRRRSSCRRSPAKSSARVNIAKTDTTAPCRSGERAAAARPGRACGQAGQGPEPSCARRRGRDAGRRRKPTATPQFDAAGGGWAVQLAAPRSEAEAQSEISRLKSKYADALGRPALAVHKAEVNGETDLSRSRRRPCRRPTRPRLCSKVKASGGDCFLAEATEPQEFAIA